MARYCTNCGSALGEEDLFCLSCGQKYAVAEPAPVQPTAQPIYPPPPPPMGAKPAVPGRALGITSMVMGIYGIFSTFSLFYAMYLVWYAEDKAGAALTKTMRGEINEVIWEVLLPCFFALFIVAVLGMAFSAVAKSKGYRNGISNAGMALSVPSLVLWLVGLIFLLA